MTAVEQSHDFVVVDTPGTDSYLTRLAHSMADTLITPLNDSFVDFDVLGTVDGTNYEVTGESHYVEMVRNARRQRRLIDGTRMDWIVVRNRLSMLGSRNKRLVGEGLGVLGTRLGFRAIDGLAERVIYREFFPRGLTALDQLDEATLGTRSEHVSRDRARRGHEPDRSAEAAARCARPAAGGGAGGVVRGARKAAGSFTTCWGNRRGEAKTSHTGHCAGRLLWPP